MAAGRGIIRAVTSFLLQRHRLVRIFTAGVTACVTPRSLSANHDGGFFGGQVGYNWQMSAWLFGLEADIQGADIGRTSTIVFPGGGGIVPSVSTGRDHLDWFGTFRVGSASPLITSCSMEQAASHLAASKARSRTSSHRPPRVHSQVAQVIRASAGAAGAGIEWGFAPNWSVKAEYLHIDRQFERDDVHLVHFPLANATYRFHHVRPSSRYQLPL